MKRARALLDSWVFLGSAALVLPFIVIGVFSPQLLGRLGDQALATVTRLFGWLFLSGVNILVLCCILVALSPWGKIRLGREGEMPEYSRFSWLAMLFSAGMGIGLVFWSIAEPLYHFSSPPRGEAGTALAARQALSIFCYHWGIHAWAVYVAVGLPMAFFQFRRGLPATVSGCFAGTAAGEGPRERQGGEGKRSLLLAAIDILAVWATVMGVVTSLGLGAMQINKGLAISYGIEASALNSGVIIAVITLLFIVSAASGVNRGIKVLSQLNVLLLILLLLLFLVFGPFAYLVKSLGLALADYVRTLVPLSTTLTLFDNEKWTKDWTIFYWAWWIAWAPFVGGFIAAISRGRTVREFIVFVMVLPALVSFVFATALGGTAMHMQLFDNVGLVATVGKSIEAALFETLRHLPGFQVTTILANLLIVSFFITSADSATLVISMFTTGGRATSCASGNRPLILFWGVVLGALACVLVASGGIKALQTASILGALPFLFVMFGLFGNLVRELIREQRGRS